MNVLLLSPWLPWPAHDGARIRILETVRHLARRHRVTVVAAVRRPDEHEHARTLAGLGVRVVPVPVPASAGAVSRRLARGLLRRRPGIESVHWSPALARQVRALTAGDACDVLHVEFPFLAPALGALAPGCRARTVLSMHNVESVRFAREPRRWSGVARRLVLWWDRRAASGWEAAAVGRFDGVTVVSELDRRWVARHAPAAAVELAPNGVATEWFRPRPAPAGRPCLVFTGSMSHPPNVDAVVWFCRAMWPALRRARPELRLVVVGRSPHRAVRALAGRPGVEVTGEVPDVRPYLADAAALVVPLRSGGGTRLKILEALAMARPVVTTALGVEGLDVTDGVEVLVADTPGDFVRQVLRVLAAPDAAARLGEAGRRLAVARYDWSRCLAGLDRLYERLLAAADRPASRAPAGPPGDAAAAGGRPAGRRA